MNHGRRLSLVELPSAQRRQSSHDAVARPRRRSLSADGLQGPPDNAVGRTITATDLLKEAKTHGNFQDSPESRRDSRRDSPVKPI